MIMRHIIKPGLSMLSLIAFSFFGLPSSLQRLRLFSLVRRRIRGDLIFMYKLMHGLLDFPCDAVFAAPPALGFEVHTFSPTAV